MNRPVYSAVNQSVLATVPRTARFILDLGCGDGSLGEAIKRRQPSKVLGVTASAHEASFALERLDGVLVRDLEGWDAGELSKEPIDTIICSHILEHLRTPRDLLTRLATRAGAGVVLIVALPNIVHWRQRMQFLRGRFRYTKGGLLDETHLRFFDWAGALELLEGTGWTLQSAVADGHFPLFWRVGRLGRALDRKACHLLPNVFGDQFILVARQAGTVE